MFDQINTEESRGYFVTPATSNPEVAGRGQRACMVASGVWQGMAHATHVKCVRLRAAILSVMSLIGKSRQLLDATDKRYGCHLLK